MKRIKRPRVASSNRPKPLLSKDVLEVSHESKRAPSLHDAECSPIIFDDTEKTSSEEAKPETVKSRISLREEGVQVSAFSKSKDSSVPP
jgi:hypothetical protein